MMAHHSALARRKSTRGSARWVTAGKYNRFGKKIRLIVDIRRYGVRSGLAGDDVAVAGPAVSKQILKFKSGLMGRSARRAGALAGAPGHSIDAPNTHDIPQFLTQDCERPPR
ncbi:MAG: hypothetical protein K9G60_10435 [Pseudolabrys sp.]|nr:hypothetical protein [Pseudolabrys sp.]